MEKRENKDTNWKTTHRVYSLPPYTEKKAAKSSYRVSMSSTFYEQILPNIALPKDEKINCKQKKIRI